MDDKEQTLALSVKFARQGDFKAMRACAREVLSADADDIEGQIIFAEASIYLGSRETAEQFLLDNKVMAASSLRGRLLAAEMAALDFDLVAEIKGLQLIIAEDDSDVVYGEYERLTLEQAAGMLADALYLSAEPQPAAQALFFASRMSDDVMRKAALYSKGLFMLNYRSQPAEYLRTAIEGYKSFVRVPVLFPHVRPQKEKKKLKVGYISADFRLHAAAYFFTPFLRDFDQEKYEVFCYMAGTRDKVTGRFKSFPVKWRDIKGLTARKAARCIYDDKIDILFDFSGHTQGSCLPILAYKPAPIQITGIGYMNTTGLPMVDYFLADSHTLPVGESTRLFSEKVYRLAGSHLCYVPDTVRAMPEQIYRPPCQKYGFVTFGSFNNFAKVSDEVLLLWRAILEQLPSAGIVIKGKICSIPAGSQLLMERLERLSLDTGRIELRPYSVDYLEQYADIDILLDAMPYNGGLTTCEALYMGVPVITMRGNSHSSRFGASILENAGAPELVASSDMEYVKKAVQLANNPRLIAQFRAGIRDNMKESPLMDAAGYMQDIEKFYQFAWQGYCAR